MLVGCLLFFFFQAEDGIRDAQESRGLGDVYKRRRRDCSVQLAGWCGVPAGWSSVRPICRMSPAACWRAAGARRWYGPTTGAPAGTARPIRLEPRRAMPAADPVCVAEPHSQLPTTAGGCPDQRGEPCDVRLIGVPAGLSGP